MEEVIFVRGMCARAAARARVCRVTLLGGAERQFMGEVRHVRWQMCRRAIIGEKEKSPSSCSSEKRIMYKGLGFSHGTGQGWWELI